MNIIVSLSGSKYCTDPFECVEDPIIDSYVFANGYKSISGASTSITASVKAECNGAFACAEILFIDSTGKVYCDGSNSCRNASAVQGENVYCRGSNACMYSAINADILRCDGDQSCAFSSIEKTNMIHGSGSYSLMGAAITSNGTSIEITLSGFNAGFGTNITCELSDICHINCYGNACDMTYITCMAINNSNCIITETNVSHSVTVGVININEFNLLYDSQSITIHNDQQCNQSPNNIHFNSTGPVCCRGKSACYQVSNITLTTQNDSAMTAITVCSGYNGCQDVTTIKNINGPIFCEGTWSCAKLNANKTNIITTNNVYCFGYRSCKQNSIYGAKNVFCSGFKSCEQTTIISDGNTSIYLLGEQSAENMTLFCDNNCSIYIICGGYNSCSPETFNCSGNCKVEYDFQYEFSILTSNIPTIATNTTNTTNQISPSPTINIPNTSTIRICSHEEGFISTTYQLLIGTKLCNDEEHMTQFISQLIIAIDNTYKQYGLTVYSNISHEYQQQFDHLFCGNFTINILTCFDYEIDGIILLNVTNSKSFEHNLTNLINKDINNSNTIIIYILNTTIVDTPTDNNNNNNNHDIIILITIISSVLFCILVITFISIYKKAQKRERTRKEMLIHNAMVVLIAIGDYDECPNDPDHELSETFFTDLPLNQDITNLTTLFGEDYLNYTIYPKVVSLYWTQQKVINLLETKAKELSESTDYDGLVVVISSHGISGHICCSDYKLISKVAIHRIFTTNYATTRQIPRIFLFDSCEGNEQQSGNFDRANSISSQSSQEEKSSSNDARGKCDLLDITHDEKNIAVKEVAKDFQERDIERQYNTIWANDTRSPDYKLILIHAANPGFQAKLNSNTGSYMLYGFATKMTQDLNANNGRNEKYISEIMDEVQGELEQSGKQHIVATYNDQTRFIRFNAKQS